MFTRAFERRAPRKILLANSILEGWGPKNEQENGPFLPLGWQKWPKNGLDLPRKVVSQQYLTRGRRKMCFGTQSEAGSRFAERMMTVVATLKQQQRNVLDYLTKACDAANWGRPAPSLLPAVLPP